MEMRAKVLLCTIPNISLYVKKNYQELAMGACYIAGSVEHAGYELDYYDFNMRLNTIRDDKALNQEEKDILSDKETFLRFFHGQSESYNRIREWVIYFSRCVNVKDYRYILFSMDRRDASSVLSTAIFHFSLLLAKEMRKLTNVPIIIGGRTVFRHTGHKYCRELLHCAEGAVDAAFTAKAHTSLLDFLRRLETKEIILPLADPLVADKSSILSMRDFLPRYHVNNQEDLFVPTRLIFPEFILEKYPRLKDVDPFFLASCRFSAGCPFRCAFCEDGESKFYKSFEVTEIVNQLEKLAQKGIKYFKFYNNNINPSPRFALDLCNQLIERNLGIFFSDSCNSWMVTEEIFQKLGKAGCVKLWYGVENPNPRLLKYFNKTTVSLGKVERNLQWASAANIWSGVNLIYNFPHESETEFNDLLNLLRNDLVDAYERNEYMLYSNTTMSLHPERFGIKLRAVTDNGAMGAYDEIDGLKWEEKLQLGRSKLMRISGVRSEVERAITYSDYALYAMRIAGYDRTVIKKAMREITDFAFANDAVDEFFNLFSMFIPNEYKYDIPKGAINGNILRNYEENAVGERNMTFIPLDY